MFKSGKNLTAQEIGYNLLREGNRVRFDSAIAEIARSNNWAEAEEAARKILRASAVNSAIDANKVIIDKIVDILKDDEEVPVGSTFRLQQMARYLKEEHNIHSKTKTYWGEGLAMAHLSEALDFMEATGQIVRLHGFEDTGHRTRCIFYEKIK
jgi:hypothetical protein